MRCRGGFAESGAASAVLGAGTAEYSTEAVGAEDSNHAGDGAADEPNQAGRPRAAWQNSTSTPRSADARTTDDRNSMSFSGKPSE